MSVAPHAAVEAWSRSALRSGARRASDRLGMLCCSRRHCSSRLNSPGSSLVSTWIGATLGAGLGMLSISVSRCESMSQRDSATGWETSKPEALKAKLGRNTAAYGTDAFLCRFCAPNQASSVEPATELRCNVNSYVFIWYALPKPPEQSVDCRFIASCAVFGECAYNRIERFK